VADGTPMSSGSEEATKVEAAGSRAEPAAPGYANYVLGVLFVVYVFNFIDRQILTILLEPIKEDLGVSDTAMGFLVGFAFALFYTFAGIPIARWADVGVRRSIIALGLAVWSGMTMLSGLAQSFTQLALARVGVGIGEAAGSPPAHSLISDYFPPERRARALGIYAMGIYIGAAFGLLAGGWIKEFFGWRAAFIVVGIPGLVLSLLVRFTVREPPRGLSDGSTVATQADSLGDVARFMASRRSFVLLALGASLLAFSGYGFGAWVPTFLVRVHGMGYAEIGTVIGLMTGIGGAAGAFIGGSLADRFAARDARIYLLVPALSAIAALPFQLPFLLIDERAFALALYFPGVLFSAMYLGPTFALTQALVKPRMRALASAILLFIINIIGLGAGPQAVGILNDVLSDRFGVEAIRYSLLLVGLTNLAAAALYLAAARGVRQDLASLGD